MVFLYTIIIRFYQAAIILASKWNRKAYLWYSGRKQVWKDVQSHLENNQQPVIWFHTASLGEFEQGRPLIEACRKQFPKYQIILTFFSPSGYEYKKDYKGAQWVGYLPIDSRSNAERWYNLLQPAMVVFIKYEFWYFYLDRAQKRNIPLFLVSAIFRKDQPFFQWYGSLHRKMLQTYSHIFVQNHRSLQLIRSYVDETKVSVTGDTRFDRVEEVAKNPKPLEDIVRFCGAYKVVVAGSTWKADDEMLCHFANTNDHFRFIIAPHDVNPARIEEMLSLYHSAQTYSSFLAEPDLSKHILIIDTVGLLSQLYRFATIAWIGGGFDKEGVHNVLEAAVFGKPVVMGPIYDKFAEAIELLECGGATIVNDSNEIELKLLHLLNNEEDYFKQSMAAGLYIKSKTGATKRILDYFEENRLLTN